MNPPRIEDLGKCHDCGLPLEANATTYEAQWHRYEAGELSGTGWTQYCTDCAPPGFLTGDQ